MLITDESTGLVPLPDDQNRFLMRAIGTSIRIVGWWLVLAMLFINIWIYVHHRVIEFMVLALMFIPALISFLLYQVAKSPKIFLPVEPVYRKRRFILLLSLNIVVLLVVFCLPVIIWGWHFLILTFSGFLVTIILGMIISGIAFEKLHGMGVGKIYLSTRAKIKSLRLI